MPLLPIHQDVSQESIHGFVLLSFFINNAIKGQYIRCDSFTLKSRKNNLIGTHVHRALMIYSPSKLLCKLNSIRSILNSNDYLDRVIDLEIQKKLQQIKLLPKEGTQKCPVYLKLPWIGNISLKFEEQCKSAISMYYGKVKPCVIFSTKKMLPAIRKDALPTVQHCMAV